MNASPVIFVIFGGTGNHARKNLIPIFYKLYRNGSLPLRFEIVGLGRSEMSDDEYRSKLFADLTAFSPSVVQTPECWKDFSSRVSYLKASIENPQTYFDLRERIDAIDIGFGEIADRFYYLSVPVHFAAKAAKHLKCAALANRAGHDKIIGEKIMVEDMVG